MKRKSQLLGILLATAAFLFLASACGESDDSKAVSAGSVERASDSSDPSAQAACQSYIDTNPYASSQILNRAYVSSVDDLEAWRVSSLAANPDGPQAAPGEWDLVRGVARDAKVSVCFTDGPVAKAPPGGAPFDRSMFMVFEDGRAVTIALGYKDTLLVQPPTAK